MEYIDESLEGEAPCEFCGESFPLVLLIEHQGTHLIGDDYSYFDEILNHDEIQNIFAEDVGVKMQPEVVIEQKQQSAVQSQLSEIPGFSNLASITESLLSITDKYTTKGSTEQHIDQNPSSSTAKSSTKNGATEEKQDLFSNKSLKDIKKFPEKAAKEFTTEKGEKLFVYGDEIDPHKDMETEKPIYKMPNNPLLSSALKNEDIEDINNLSDDDCGESLEEFWKRARDFLKKNRVRNE